MIIGKSAARSSQRNVGDRPKTMCRQKLRNEVPEARKLALSCSPSMGLNFASTIDFFRLRNRCFSHQRACDSCARRLLAEALVNSCRTVALLSKSCVRPGMQMTVGREESAPSTASFCVFGAALLDHLVGAYQQGWRYHQVESSCGLEVNNQLELGRQFDRQL